MSISKVKIFNQGTFIYSKISTYVAIFVCSNFCMCNIEIEVIHINLWCVNCFTSVIKCEKLFSIEKH